MAQISEDEFAHEIGFPSVNRVPLKWAPHRHDGAPSISKEDIRAALNETLIRAAWQQGLRQVSTISALYARSRSSQTTMERISVSLWADPTDLCDRLIHFRSAEDAKATSGAVDVEVSLTSAWTGQEHVSHQPMPRGSRGHACSPGADR